MRDWALALMVGLIFIAIAGCTATGIISSNKTQVEIKKIELEKLKFQNESR